MCVIDEAKQVRTVSYLNLSNVYHQKVSLETRSFIARFYTNRPSLPFLSQQSQHANHHVGGSTYHRSHAAREPIPTAAAVQRRDAVQHGVPDADKSHHLVTHARQQWWVPVGLGYRDHTVHSRRLTGGKTPKFEAPVFTLFLSLSLCLWFSLVCGIIFLTLTSLLCCIPTLSTHTHAYIHRSCGCCGSLCVFPKQLLMWLILV